MRPLPIKYTLDSLSLTDEDEFGCWWVTQAVRGWRGTPPPRNDRRARSSADGAHRGYPYRDPRILTLTGECKAPTASARAYAERRITDVLTATRELIPVTRIDENEIAETAYVEYDDIYDPIPYNQYRFKWSLQLAAPDPRLFEPDWVSSQSSVVSPGTGGVVSTGLGVVSTSPGVVAGTSAVTSIINEVARRSGPSQIVYELIGPGDTMNVNQINTNSVVTYRGVLGVGESVFINTDNQPAHDVPGCPVKTIPARAVVLNGYSARTALFVSGQWPTLLPGITSTFLLSGVNSDSATLKVHTRGASA